MKYEEDEKIVDACKDCAMCEFCSRAEDDFDSRHQSLWMGSPLSTSEIKQLVGTKNTDNSLKKGDAA